jgi:pimeloyl-ACP methyl ester carboxylesterase
MYTLQLPDGRKIGYMRYGAPGGRPVFYFHGLPGSRCEGLLLDEPGRELNVQVIAVDRPGYGLSRFQPNRQLCDWPQDVLALADALEFDRFMCWAFRAVAPMCLPACMQSRSVS